VEPVNRRRLEMLEAAGLEASLEEILAAFLTPALEKRPEESVVPLMGRVLSNPNLYADRMYKRHFALVFERFSAALGRAVPNLPKQELLWRQLFMVGTMTHLMALGQILPAITAGVCDMTDRGAVVGHVVRFLAGGFRAASGEQTGNKTGEELQCAG